MFFKKKAKLPISEDDKALIDNAFSSIQRLFGKEIFFNSIITPTEEFFPIPYHGKEDDALQIFEIVASFMKTDVTNIDVIFYSERKSIELSDGLFPVADENETFTTGKYVEYDNGDIEIFIEEQELKDFLSLVATIAHELAHFKLRHEAFIKDEDEILTDVLTIACGLGIFTANTSLVQMHTWTDGSFSGWQLQRGSGYLHYKVCGYALAVYIFLRNEEPFLSWTNFLERDILREYKKSVKYLKHFHK